MKLALVIILLCSILVACKRNVSKARLFILPNQLTFSDSANKILKRNIERGYVEYFSINGAKFKFQKKIQEKNVYDLQVLQNNKWVTNLVLSMPKYNFNLTQDLDLNHYFDLTFLEGENIKTYLFDDVKQRFDSSAINFSYDYALLDSNQLLYGANNHRMNTWNIDIFFLKDRTKIYLLKSKIDLLDNTNNGGFEITKAFIYKCNNGSDSDTTLIDRISINKQFNDFSLLNFMKELARNRKYY